MTRLAGMTRYSLSTKLLEYVRLGVPVVVSWTPTIAQYFPDDTNNLSLVFKNGVRVNNDFGKQGSDKYGRRIVQLGARFSF